MPRPVVVVVVFAVAAILLAPAAARADGDPASDVLYSQNVFFPFEAKIPASLQLQLTKAAAEAKRAGYPIRVALIMRPTDLGVVTSLWRKPQQYAQFLGLELSFLYRGRLLIVMPNGFGIYHGRKPTRAEKRVLASIPIVQGDEGMTRTGLKAVLALARAGGHHVATPSAAVPTIGRSSASRGSSAGSERLIIIASIAAVGLLAFAALALRYRGRAGGRREDGVG